MGQQGRRQGRAQGAAWQAAAGHLQQPHAAGLGLLGPHPLVRQRTGGWLAAAERDLALALLLLLLGVPLALGLTSPAPSPRWATVPPSLLPSSQVREAQHGNDRELRPVCHPPGAPPLLRCAACLLHGACLPAVAQQRWLDAVAAPPSDASAPASLTVPPSPQPRRCPPRSLVAGAGGRERAGHQARVPQAVAAGALLERGAAGEQRPTRGGDGGSHRSPG